MSTPATAARHLALRWSGVAPFLAFTALFLILPTLYIVVGAFRTPDGAFTLDFVRALRAPNILNAYWSSIRISFWSALLGTVFGLAMAMAMVNGGLSRRVRGPLLTFSGVASNFAGVPLAFAFIATLGPAGIVTLWLRSEFGINLRAHYGFNLLSTTGLILTYLFFQIPLMILIITPALDGLRREWREAASILGASGLQYWRMVALPILLPSVLGCFALLFANAFGAVATAIALTGSTLNIAPILLFAQIRGDVLGSPGLGYALALGMILIAGITNGLSIWLRARSERWLR